MTAATLLLERGGRGRPAGTKAPRTLAIEAYLREHYPCQALPLGALTEVGERFGVGREWIRQIANGLDYGRLYHQPKPPRPCRNCGLPAQPHSPLCDECAFVTLVCGTCGTLYKSPRNVVLNQQSSERGYRGGQFCSRACFQQSDRVGGRLSRVSWRCQQCGQEEMRQPSETWHKYCSQKCWGLSRRTS